MNKITLTALSTLIAIASGGCVATTPTKYVDAEAWGANYTEDYIQTFSVVSMDGKAQLSGSSLKPFSKGGTGGVECCSVIPGVGERVHITWQVDGSSIGDESVRIFNGEVTIKGSVSQKRGVQSALIVRFFPNNQLEVEFVPMDDVLTKGISKRLDKLFYGQRVMRHIGE